MQLELSKKEFRRLLDMVYIGNWILNSTRGEDRFRDYDQVESLLFEKARQEGMPILAETYRGETVPSRAFVEGGIHEAIMEYENNVFFDILAEDLAVGTWMMSHRREQLCRAHQPDRRLHHRVRGAWH